MLLIRHRSITDHLRSSHSSRSTALILSYLVHRCSSLARWLLRPSRWKMSIRLVYMQMYLIHSMIYSCIVYSIDIWHQPQVTLVAQLAVIPHLWSSSNVRITKRKHWWTAFGLPMANHWSTRKGSRSHPHLSLVDLVLVQCSFGNT